MQEDRFFYDDFPDDDEDTQKDKFLTFIVGTEEYCVDIAHVVEVIGMQKITPVPEMPEFVRGVINLRGQVIPVTDVRMRFGMETLEYTERTCIVVVEVRNSFVGLVVDSVSDVLDIPEHQMEETPKVNRCFANRFIKGLGKIGEDVKIVLDIQKLLFDDEQTEDTGKSESNFP